MNPDPYLAASDALLYAAAFGLLACAWIFVRFLSRRTTRAHARSIHPSIRVAPPCHSCHQAPGIHPRILATNYTAIRVCDKCDHAGEQTGRWIDLSERAS